MMLREYIESFTPEDSTLSVRDKIEAARSKLFDFTYEIFDPAYKSVLETHFIRKFYMREIGAETEGLFKFNLETWLLINMPFYNKLFESESIKYDPLVNSAMNISKTDTNTKDSTSNASGNSASTGTASGTLSEDNFDRQLESDNPDTRLALTATDGQGVIEYAASIKENNENNTKSSNSNNNDSGTFSNTATGTLTETDDYIETRVGKTGDVSYSKMLNEYRDSLLRIENMMFKEMQELFMLVY